LQTKLFLSYSLILVILILTFSISIYSFLYKSVVTKTKEDIQQQVATISERLDNFIITSENITRQIYVNTKLMDALMLISGDISVADRYTASKEINDDIFIASWVSPKFNRITLFNSRGDCFTNKESDTTVTNSEKYENFMNIARTQKGRASIIYSSKDDLSSNDKKPIYSLIRQIKFPTESERGFLEIQITLEELLGSDFLASGEAENLYIFKNKDLLFPVQGDINKNVPHRVEMYLQKIGEKIEENTEGDMEGNTDIIFSGNKKEYVQFHYSEATGYTTLYSIPYDKVYASVNMFSLMAFIIMITVLGLSLIVYYYLSRSLTKPLRKLRQALKEGDIINIGISIDNEEKNDEIEMLNNAFKSLSTRLKKSINETIEAKTLQFKTHFDVLQAQINPHFLFNMLGIMAILSDKGGNDNVAGLCRKLASFLRYTVSTLESLCTIKDEIEFTREYLELMKLRYTHRLDFEIKLDERIQGIELPKLTIQPLVENCITHGFNNMDGTMCITVNAIQNNDLWEITISDNGTGFEPDVVTNIKRQIDAALNNENQLQSKGPSTFGGMGIVNTIVRLKILYKNEIEFDAGNRDVGAYVRISSVIPTQYEAIKEMK
jgi:two-component system, sensor histidine kinase YesM